MGVEDGIAKGWLEGIMIILCEFYPVKCHELLKLEFLEVGLVWDWIVKGIGFQMMKAHWVLLDGK